MLSKIVFCLFTFFINRALAQGECTDVRGRQIAHGHHYVPGPDTCSLCICDNGHAKVCKAVLCSPPQDCRSFRVGSTCCEFICLDDVVKPHDSADLDFRLVAIVVTVMLVLILSCAVYRWRMQKRQRANHTEDQRSLTSIGYISGSMAYVGGTCETGLAAWKPHGNYMPRGEAPPPYDEVVAQTRAEAMSRMTEPPFHRSYPTTVETMARDEAPCSHLYPNMPRPITQMPNPQACYNAPLLQPIHPPESREPMNPIYNHIPPNSGPPYGAIRLTGSLGTISSRGLASLLQRACMDRDRHARPHFQQTVHNGIEIHRTIPRISTVIDTIALDSSIAGFNRADRSLQNEIRRSFHKPSETNRLVVDTGRSMPRNLNLASNELSRSSNIEPNVPEVQIRLPGNVARSRIHSEEHTSSSETKPQPKPNIVCERGKTDKLSVAPEAAMLPAQASLPLTVDKPSCVCSYESESVPTEEADDYRSECENCKSASSSRWVLEQEGWPAQAEEGTQTLQRRAPPPAQPPPAVSTLPQPVGRTSRNVMGQPSNWENWFNSMPDSDSESEEE